MSVNLDISGEAGALAALPDEGGRGCHKRKLMPSRSETDWLFPEYFQLKILTAYDYLGQRMHWLILASRIDQELYAIWNSASISTKNAVWVCVEVGLDGTKKLVTAVPQHALNCFAQVF